MTLKITSLTIVAGLAAQSASAQSWNAAADFSATTNPSGDWSYGWATARPVSPVQFRLGTRVQEPIAGFHVWTDAGRGLPSLFENTSDHSILYANDPVCPPGVMGAHPDADGSNAVVRWTSPFTGSAFVNARFGTITLDPTGNTVDVAVIHNGVQLFAANPPRGTGAVYTHVVNVHAGDTLDFAVGNGSNGHSDDSTSLDLNVTRLCPADFNQDGVTDFFDYLDFVDALAANRPEADFNADGVIDFFDYLDFVQTFSSNC